MLAVTDADVFVVLNTVMQRYPKDKHPKVYYGISAYLTTSTQKEHALVLDAKLAFEGVEPRPQNLMRDGKVDTDVLDAYLAINPKKLPIYTWRKPNVIEKMLNRVSSNEKHALSALLSNFTPSARPAVKAKVIEFLLSSKSNNFVLPESMCPKRGRAVEYYQAAIKADYSDLKADILKDRPDTYDGRYWKAVIAKEAKKKRAD